MKSLCPVYLGRNTYKIKLSKSKVVSTFRKYFLSHLVKFRLHGFGAME